MAKPKKSTPKNQAQSIATQRQNGLKAFQRGDYSLAILTWEHLPPDQRPAEALAEAYFRRGLNQFYPFSEQANSSSAYTDLQQAHLLAPSQPLYAYHVGLAACHLDDPVMAVKALRAARQAAAGDKILRARAAYPLALALLKSGQSLQDDPLWAELSIHEQDLLLAAAAFNRRPYRLPAGAGPLWRGLAAYDAGQAEQAQALLAQPAGSDPRQDGLRRFYLGALAARRGDLETARREWVAAYAGGFRPPRLKLNLGELFQRQAEERLQANDPEAALANALEAQRHVPADKALSELLSQAHQRLAYQAAQSGQWPAAQAHWQAATRADTSSFRLAYNLALAYERAEDFIAAGQAWREALRRRPRRSDHPDAVSDEQVSRLWQQAAECYRRAGEVEEASRVYQQALKWNPESVSLRMAAAESLLAAGRPDAAGNELERVLERQPDHIPALLRRGEIYFQSDVWWQRSAALESWQKVLALQPDHPQARQLISEYYLDVAENYYSWDNYTLAIEHYRHALEYNPRNLAALVFLGECYLCLKDEAAGGRCLADAQAQAGKDLDVYNNLIHVWLSFKRPEQAWQVLAQAEANVPDLPFQFYIAQAFFCAEHKLADLAGPWVERALEKMPPDQGEALVTLGFAFGAAGAIDLGRSLLQRAITLGKQPGMAYVFMGLLYAIEDDRREALRCFKEAEKIARRLGDQELSGRIKEARNLLNIPPFMRKMFVSALVSGEMPFPDLEEELDDYDWP